MITEAPVKKTKKKPGNNGAHAVKDIAEAGRKHLGGEGAPDFAKLPPRTVNGHRSREIPSELLNVHPDEICRSPTQPREEFDQEKIARLAASFKKVGMLLPVIVRKAPIDSEKPYELIAGERRWRAALHAFLKAIPARLVEVTDEEAMEIQATENLDREDLNPIERARQFQILLERGSYTQKTLGVRFGLGQPEVSRTIGLLKLPEYWQKRVAAGELTPTHVSSLVAWLDYPQVLQMAQAKYEEALKEEADRPLTTDEFAERVEEAVWDCSRDMTLNTWVSECRQFKTTPAIEKELDVKEFKREWGGSAKRAMNVELWDRLQAEANAKKAKKKSEAVEAEDKKADTPAQRREKDKAKSEQFAKRLYRWKIAWLQGLCSARLLAASDATVLRWLLFYAVRDDARGREDSFRKACHEFNAKDERHLEKLDQKQLCRLGVMALQAWVQHDIENYHAGISPDDVERLADELQVDVATEWKLTEEFLQLHTKDQIVELLKEWKWHGAANDKCIYGDPTRKDLIISIMRDSAQPNMKAPCPREVLKCKPVRLR